MHGSKVKPPINQGLKPRVVPRGNAAGSKQERPPPAIPLEEQRKEKRFPGPQDFPVSLTLGHGEQKDGEERQESRNQLHQFLTKNTLPRCIRLTKTLPVTEGAAGMREGDLYLFHFIFESQVVHARDSGGKVLHLPVYARQKYEVLPLDPRLDDVTYNGTEELINADPLPDKVRVLEAHCSTHPEEIQEVDDIVYIKGIEDDPERGKVLVAISGTVPVKYSTEMFSCEYTTMIIPDFQTMADLLSQDFPLRVRLPDSVNPFSKRDFKTEEVLNLTKISESKFVVATRKGDPNIYAIPVNAAITFETVDTLKGTDILGMLPALYPQVNPAWGLIDPTQAPLPAQMDGIPQPKEEVLKAWFTSPEGRAKACEIAEVNQEDLHQSVIDAEREMRRLKTDFDALSKKKSLDMLASLSVPDPSAPPRPPRPRRGSSDDAMPAPPLPPVPKRIPVVKTSSFDRPPPQPERRPKPSPTRTKSADHSDIAYLDNLLDIDRTSDSEEYEYVDEVLPKVPKSSDPKAITEYVNKLLAKKETELVELRREASALRIKCQNLEKRNEELSRKFARGLGPYVNFTTRKKEPVTVKEDDNEDDEYLEPILNKLSPSRSRQASTRQELPLPPRPADVDTDDEPRYDMPPVMSEETHPRLPPGLAKEIAASVDTFPPCPPRPTQTATHKVAPLPPRSNQAPAKRMLPPPPNEKDKAVIAPLTSSQHQAPAETVGPLPVEPDQTATTATDYSPLRRDSAKPGLEKLTVDEVADYLREHGFAQYADTFVSESIDGDTLLALDEELLQDMKMSRLHAVRLLVAIKKTLGKI